MTAKYILLVEDNPDDQELAIRALKKNNIQAGVKVVNDGAAALEFLLDDRQRDTHDRKNIPSLVLLDLKLPKVDGHEVLRQLRANDITRYLPVVVMTSSLEEQDITRSYQLGANSYIRKPVNFDRFVEVVSQLGNYWLTINQSPYA